MDLDKVLQENQLNERSSLTIVHFCKHIFWHSCWKMDFEICVNRLPEDVLVKWLVTLIRNLQNGTKMPCSFDGKGPLNSKVLPFQFEVFSHSLEVSYINTDKHGTSKVSLFFIVDGPETSIRKFEKAIVHDNEKEFQLYSPKENTYCMRVKS